MQQLFSKETFIHTAMGLRSGEDEIGGRGLSRMPGWQRTRPQKRDPYPYLTAQDHLWEAFSSAPAPKLYQEIHHMFSYIQVAGTTEL